MHSAARTFIHPLGAACLIASAAACDRPAAAAGDADATGGLLIASIQTEVGHVLPPVMSQVEQKMVADQIFEPLAWLGDAGHLDRDYRPALADSWSWEADSSVIVFRLNPAARWHDGAPVRASDVRFTFALVADSVVGSKERETLSRIDSVTTRDSITAVFWFEARYPEQLYDAAARMLIVPEHVLANEPRATLQTSPFGRSPIGSGRFRLGKWTPTSIELVADTAHYRGRAKLDRVIFAVTTDPNALSTRLATGEIDAAEITNAEQFRTLSARPELTARVLPAFDYAFLQFNMRDPRRRAQPHPLFADVNLRRALTMALDRERLVRSQFDTLGVVAIGPMTRAQPLADSTLPPIPYDSAGAARLLDSLGWVMPAGKTVRERAGQPLQFKAIVPTISKNRMAIAVRVQEAFRTAGVQLDVEALEANSFIGRIVQRDFDAAFNGTRAEASIGGLRPYWSVAGSRDPRGMNFGSYESPAFDAHLDSALASPDATSARAHARQAFTTIVADAPAVWLYEARTAPMIHKRFRTAHVIPTAWWAGIADWSIPLAERLPRDRAGLTAAP
jgi:peptide/nickel transport system substrate-binding protein